MRTIIAFFLLTAVVSTSYSQIDTIQSIVALAKIYHQFHDTTDITDHDIKKLSEFENTPLKYPVLFIKEICTANNSVLEPEFLSRPDSASLRHIYAAVKVNHNMFSDSPKDNALVAREILSSEFAFYEAVMIYYNAVFTSVINKNKDLDMSKYNFMLNKLGLDDDTQKGVFFLQFAQRMGSQAIAFVRYGENPNYEKAYDHLNRMAKINSLPYYKFLGFYFPDISIIINRRKQSYKKYAINNYYQLLLAHHSCLKKLGKSDKEKQDLLMSSILSKKNYYKYSSNKDVLHSLFRKVGKY
jgi:uncharacterized protein YfkK (UPF0435 family)